MKPVYCDEKEKASKDKWQVVY